MGLSSSQARLLTLTARMHQIEYKAARLENMKLQMANESRRVYEDYLDAMDKTKIQVKHLTTDGSITYKDITKYADFTDSGYALMYKDVVYDGTSGKTFTDLVKATYNASATDTVVNAYTAGQFETIITNLINSGDVIIVTKDNKANKWHQPTDTDIVNFSDWETSVSTNTGLQEVTDEVELKKAEAKYEADMKRIDLKDRKYDTDLAALDTERNAIKSEMETLKTVAKDNVERTFKLFS
jgi:archaellum component FlaF (FlaF/FlaG flagellin family)